MWDNMIQGTLAIMLFACSVQDFHRKKFSLWIVLLAAVVLCICIPFSGKIIFFDKIGGLFVGILVIGISWITKGKIGMGDGIILCVTGIGLGFWTNMELFAIALFLAAVISIFLLALGLTNRKKSIPFVPFMLVAYLIRLCIV